MYQSFMNRSLGQFCALAFAVCFLALQFHPVGEPQSEHNDKRIFHIEEVSIDKSIDNRFIHVQQFALKQIYLSQQKAQLKQLRQYLGAIERQVEHPFRQFMLECLSAICLNYQDKLFTSFSYLQKRELSFEFNPILTSNLMQVYSDESDSKTSLS